MIVNLIQNLQNIYPGVASGGTWTLLATPVGSSVDLYYDGTCNNGVLPGLTHTDPWTIDFDTCTTQGLYRFAYDVMDPCGPIHYELNVDTNDQVHVLTITDNTQNCLWSQFLVHPDLNTSAAQVITQDLSVMQPIIADATVSNDCGFNQTTQATKQWAGYIWQQIDNFDATGTNYIETIRIYQNELITNAIDPVFEDVDVSPTSPYLTCGGAGCVTVDPGDLVASAGAAFGQAILDVIHNFLIDQWGYTVPIGTQQGFAGGIDPDGNFFISSLIKHNSTNLKWAGFNIDDTLIVWNDGASNNLTTNDSDLLLYSDPN